MRRAFRTCRYEPRKRRRSKGETGEPPKAEATVDAPGDLRSKLSRQQ